MAFSTQKDFFNVPFMNESVELDCCKKACVKLKRYESTIDTRSWASDETKQSKFLSDLVTCQYPTTSCNGEGDFSRTNIQCGNVSVDNGELGQLVGTSAGGDSLLECANIHLAEYQKLLKIKTSLEKQLEVSSEHLKTATEENKKIREIIANKLDSNTAKDFYNKIKKLTACGKLNKNEENEMCQVYKKMTNMHKAYEVLQAENHYLKRLIEKLTTRVTLDSINTQPEESKDVCYLQKEINCLRKECLLLRQIEDEYLVFKQQQKKKSPCISDKDAENIKAIMKERNSLREKCKSLKNVDQQIQELEQQAEAAKKEAIELNNSITQKTEYINKLEGEMEKMQKYYEAKSQNAYQQEQTLKAQVEDLKDDLVKAKCESQKADVLRMEVSCLRNEILKRDLALNDYDCQYKQLMDVVNEIQSVNLQCLHDNQTQTCKDQTEELAFYTSVTLSEIMKELKKKGCIDNEFMAAYGLAGCDKQCEELKCLQHQVDTMKKELQKAADCKAICADAIKRFRELEAENAKLKEGEKTMANMMQKIDNLDQEIHRSSQEANKIGKDLQGAIGLVRDISEVQLKNQQLANAVSAINSRDDQKIIDDLRRQLEEEMQKLKNCQEVNAKLLEKTQLYEMNIKELKDLNNKLKADNAHLKNILTSDGEYNKDYNTFLNLPPDYEVKNKHDALSKYGISASNDGTDNNIMSRAQQKAEISGEFLASSCNDETNNVRTRQQQNAGGIDEYVTSNNNDTINIMPSRSQQEADVIGEFATSSRIDGTKKEPTRPQQKEGGIDENVTSNNNDTINIMPSRSQQKADVIGEFATSSRIDGTNKEPTRPQQKEGGIDENVTSNNNDTINIMPSRSQQEADVIGEFATSSRIDGTNKEPTRPQQTTGGIDEIVTSINNETINIPSRVQKAANVMGDFGTSSRIDGANKEPTRPQQKAGGKDQIINSSSNVKTNKEPSGGQQKADGTGELVTSSNDGPNKKPNREQRKMENIGELATSSRINGANKEPTSRLQQKAGGKDQIINSSSNVKTNKEPSQAQQKADGTGEFVTSSTRNDGTNNRSTRAQQKEGVIDEFLNSSSNDETNEELSRASQTANIIGEFATSSINNGTNKEPGYSQHRVESDYDFSSTKSPASKQQKSAALGQSGYLSRKDATSKRFIYDQQQQQQQAAALGQFGSFSHKNAISKQFTYDQQQDATLDDFVNKRSNNLKYILQQGKSFEKEFRNILEEFIYECSHCFCRLFNMKSKLYTICHKLCHSGIDVLSFRELAYLHKKIYTQADLLLPGCLLDMILSDHKEQVETILMSVVVPRLVDNQKLDSKCCCCKNELCCNNSEEMLKDKVNKLEKDIEIARDYLETLKCIPLDVGVAADNGDSTDTNNSTFRASSSSVTSQQKLRSSKTLKKLRARIIK